MHFINFKFKNIQNKIKQPEDVYSAIYPLFFVCNLVGLAPYSLRKLPNGKREFQFALWPVIRSVVLVTVFLSVLGYHYTDQSLLEKSDDIKYKVRIFQEIFASILSCFEIIFGCFFTIKIIQVFKNIEEVDAGFRSLAVWVPYKRIYIQVVIQLIIFVFAYSVTIFFIIFFPNNKNQNYSAAYNIFMRLFTSILPYCVNILMELQYIHYLNILRMRFKLLNDYLETLIQKNKINNGWIDGEVAVISEKFKEDIKISGKIPASLIAISDPVFVVDQAVSLHIKLTDTAQMINYAFCVQQLLRITLAFISVVTALFIIAVNFSSTKEEMIEDDVMFTLWAFSNALEVIFIVWITSETTEEANTCPRILHRIRNNTSNTELQDTIEIYSLQMYHNRLYFSVCGLFPLDYSLLYTIVAGVTTYLVILIQFNIEFVKKSEIRRNTTTIQTPK